MRAVLYVLTKKQYQGLIYFKGQYFFIHKSIQAMEWIGFNDQIYDTTALPCQGVVPKIDLYISWYSFSY
jgi:hypothetical protein